MIHDSHHHRQHHLHKQKHQQHQQPQSQEGSQSKHRSTLAKMKRQPCIPNARKDATMAVVYSPSNTSKNAGKNGSDNSGRSGSSGRSGKTNKRRSHKKKPIGVLCLGGMTSSQSPTSTAAANAAIASADGIDYFEWKTKRWWCLPAASSSASSGRTGSAAVTIDNVTYVCGGMSQSHQHQQQKCDTVDTFDFQTKKWELLPSTMSKHRWYPGAAVGRMRDPRAASDAQHASAYSHGDADGYDHEGGSAASVPVVWVGGGRDEAWKELTCFELYIPSLQRWMRPSSCMKTPRFACAAVSIQNQSKIMVIGGYDGVQWLTSIEMYYIDQDMWFASNETSHSDAIDYAYVHSIPHLPVALSFPRATVIELQDGSSCVVCVGGIITDDSDDDRDADSEIHSTVSDGAGDTTDAGRGNAPGSKGSAPSSCYAYFETENVWRAMPISYNFEGAMITSIGDTLFVVGGKPRRSVNGAATQCSTNGGMMQANADIHVAADVDTDVDTDVDCGNTQHVHSWRLSNLSISTLAATRSSDVSSLGRMDPKPASHHDTRSQTASAGSSHQYPQGSTIQFPSEDNTIPQDITTKSVVSKDTTSTAATITSASSLSSSAGGSSSVPKPQHSPMRHKAGRPRPKGKGMPPIHSPKRTPQSRQQSKQRKDKKAGQTPSTSKRIVDHPPLEVLSSIFVPSAFPAYDQDYISLASTTAMETVTNDTDIDADNENDTLGTNSTGDDGNSNFHDSFSSSGSSLSSLRQLAKPKLKKTTSVPVKVVEEFLTTDSSGQAVIYTGEMTKTQPLKPHGKGTMVWMKSQNVYTGQFDINGNRHGRGIMKYYNQNGKPRKAEDGSSDNDGSKKKKSSKDLHEYDSYKGSFMQNKKHGKGVYTWKSGKQFEGNYSHGKPDDPNGTLTFPDGSIYMGMFRKGERTGRGILHLSSGRYQGDFVNGKYHGYGTMAFIKKHQEYTGYFKAGKAHGQGRLTDTKTNTVLYQGLWYEDAPDIHNKFKKEQP